MDDPSKLNFGALSAERDIDSGLKSYFVESDAFKNLRDGKKTVVLGNRGTGKSAIFKMIADHEQRNGALVLELRPEDYSYELLSRSIQSEGRGMWAKQGTYAAAWKYLLYVLSMKKLAGTGGLKHGHEARIYEYLRDRHANVETNIVGLLLSYLKRLEGVKVGSFEATLKVKELQQLYKLEELAQFLPAINSACKKKRLIILIDELDKGWDASEDAIAFVAGLFQAATTISQQTPNLRVLISLRRELYESIPALFDDAQKIRDLIQIIQWDEPQLLELISRRIAHCLPETASLSAEARWFQVFSEQLGPRQSNSFHYLMDRTLHRPRELIQLCTMIRDQLVSEQLRLPALYRSVAETEMRYSEERTQDIVAEYRFQYPGLRSVFETFRGESTTLDRQELEEHCLRIACSVIRVDSEAKKWCDGIEPEDLIRVLWSVGFLRAQAVGGLRARQRAGSTYLGSHQISSLSLSNVPRFHVHPMFRSVLGVRDN